MHIAILEAGRTNPDMPAEFQDYPDMFETLFTGQTSNGIFQFSNVSVIDGMFPESGHQFTTTRYQASRVRFLQKCCLCHWQAGIFRSGAPRIYSRIHQCSD